MSKEKYHKVLLPLVDIYEHAGDQVFDKLARSEGEGKNLAIFPYDFLDDLSSTNNGVLAAAKEDALKQVKNIVHNGVKSSLALTGAALTFQFSAGLDIAFMDYAGRAENKPKFSLTNVVEQIGKSLGIKPVLITSNSKKHIKYASRDIFVEDPEFLLVNRDIVNEGLIKGNKELFDALEGTNRTGIPIEQACEILRRDKLYPNQFIQSESKISLDGTYRDEDGAILEDLTEDRGSIYKHARVTGRIVKNKSGSRMELEDMVVSLVPFDKKYGYQLSVGKHPVNNMFGIMPRDEEQFLAMQYGLLDPNISLMFLCGSQGSGKTLLSYVCAVDQILGYGKDVSKARGYPNINGSYGRYDQIVVLKPNDILGGKSRDVGYLPGNLFDKIRPHIAPYIDAHKESNMGRKLRFEDMLLHPNFKNDFGDARDKQLEKALGGYFHPYKEPIEMTFSGFMRGRSFTNTLILMDETQNWTPYEVKTLIERSGEGCKIIVMGDPAQVDNPLCTREINGLTSAISQYIDKPYSSLLRLSTNYRSQMSADSLSWKVYSQG